MPVNRDRVLTEREQVPRTRFFTGLSPHLSLRSAVTVEDLPMSRKRQRSAAAVIRRHPCEKSFQVGILRGFGRILVRLPRPVSAIAQAGFFTRVQEDQLGLPWQNRFDLIAVAAFDDPLGMARAESPEIIDGCILRAQNCAGVRRPCDRVKVEHCDAITRKRTGKCAFSGARISENCKSHTMNSTGL